MKLQFLVQIELDESNINHPSAEDCKLIIEDALTTPDNDHFGIKSIVVYQRSLVDIARDYEQ